MRTFSVYKKLPLSFPHFTQSVLCALLCASTPHKENHPQFPRLEQAFFGGGGEWLNSRQGPNVWISVLDILELNYKWVVWGADTVRGGKGWKEREELLPIGGDSEATKSPVKRGSFPAWFTSLVFAPE